MKRSPFTALANAFAVASPTPDVPPTKRAVGRYDMETVELVPRTLARDGMANEEYRMKLYEKVIVRGGFSESF